MQKQTRQAVDGAHVVLLLFDARAGITPLDSYFADMARKFSVPVILVANKCESRKSEMGLLESYSLGLGEAIVIASEHGLGMPDLEDALTLKLKKNYDFLDINEVKGLPISVQSISAVDETGESLKLAIVGRPNVGKSTLINTLVGEQRLITGPEPGITRDAISIEWNWNGNYIKLIDTAGMRRKSRITEKVEKLSVNNTLEAIRFANVVVVVFDSTAFTERQDLMIARHVIDEGRGIVIALNKWDAVKHRQKTIKNLRDRLSISLPQIRGVSIVTLSAITQVGIEKLLPEVFSAFEVWNQRVPTALINKWLQQMIENHPPPIFRGRRIRIRYITQNKARPPTFTLFASQPKGLPDSYIRYLINGIREEFNFPGVPIRINVRAGRNPFNLPSER